MKYGKTILLIEDDLAIIDVYKIALEKEKFRVEIITLGSEAIKKMREINENKTEKPNLILLDIILPDINGIDILKEIRRGEKTKKLPVFILTNYSSEDVRKDSFSLNAKQYIIKTECTPRELIKLIKEQLK